MKKYKYFMVMLLIALSFTLKVAAQGIKFHKTNWGELRATAKAENKLIFIDFYTDWCIPCKQMATNIFPLKAVGDFFNEHFIAVQMDAEKEGKDLAARYAVKAYPTMIFITPDGEVASRIIGSVNANELIARSQNALMPDSVFVSLKNKFEEGQQIGNKELYQLITMFENRGDEIMVQKAFEKYFSSNGTVDKETYNLITGHANSSKNSSFIFLMKNRTRFSSLIGKNKVDDFIKNLLIRELETSKNLTSKEYQIDRKKLQALVNLSEKELLEMDSNHYWNTKDEDNYMKACKALYDKYIHDDEQAIGNMLGAISRKIITKPENLQMAKEWAIRAFSLKDNGINGMQLALIYKGLHDKENALKYARLALAAAKKDNAPYLEKLKVIKKEIETSFD